MKAPAAVRHGEPDHTGGAAFNRDYTSVRAEDQDKKNAAVNASYANIAHNDLNDNNDHCESWRRMIRRPIF